MGDTESEDQRRHKIYIQINDQDPYGVGKLTTSQYVTLKHNDQAAYDFIQQLLQEKKISIVEGKINSLFRSIDDIDYTPIILPEETPSSSLISAVENSEHEPQPRFGFSSQSERTSAKPPTTVQPETVDQNYQCARDF